MENKIRYISGDLLESKDSLCHCVSECMTMGKGLAIQLRRKFKMVEKLKDQGVKVGGIAVLYDFSNNRYIYYLVTKKFYWSKPTYDTLEAALQSMLVHMKTNGVSSVSMPR